MEDKPDEQVEEELEGASSDSFVAGLGLGSGSGSGSGSDDEDEEPSVASGQDDGAFIEEPLTEQEVEELVAEFLEVESKAAEAQEALEEESLEKVESEVREELSCTLKGDDLETAVEDEMTTLKEEWEARLDELETESANLLEQLDGAGVELPKLYKWIESQAPNSCRTDAWKRRAHWVGSQVTSEATKSVADAENYLETNWPVRRRHGKLLEEGASGFLQKKLVADEIKEAVTEGEVDWTSLSKLFSGNAPDDVASFGSKKWASVYMANNPMEAAAMGLQFPGVDEVEEIGDIDFSSSDPFVADGVANDLDLALSEKQRKNYRKVNEEDDAKVDRKLQIHLKQRRCLKKNKQKQLGSGDKLADSDDPLSLDDHSNRGKGMETLHSCDDVHIRDTSDSLSPLPVSEPRQLKRPRESEPDPNSKKSCAVLIETNEANDMKDNHNVIFIEDESTVGECDGKVKADGHCISSLKEKFFCTACDKVAIEVHAHPLLRVIVCKDCKLLMEERLHMKDQDCSECYCGWCGRTSEFVTCTSCNILFCTSCIRRNLGEDCLSKIQDSRWQCCCCSPKLLDRLTIQLEKAIGSTGVSLATSDSDSENSDSDIRATDNARRKRQKKIRRILDDAELGEDTKRKIAIEKERQERLKSLKVQFSSKSNVSSVVYSGGLPEGASIEMLGDATTGFIVNVVREKGEGIVRIPPSISSKLKAHQVAGIRFLWENIVQSIAKVKSGDRGLGCILAHTMGLGKTFQVIAFLYTAMRCVDLGLRTALIVTPVNVLHNWKKEFIKWRPSESEIKPLRVFMLEDVPRERRLELLTKWRTKGGVFLIGYAAFRNLSLGKNVKDRSMARVITCALRDGPDILVCDEAHTIKNTRAETTQALKLVRCQRRIALTGSPLQNNLMEYYCMVDFVREGFLGSSLEFRNRFQNPIENGQHTNSTAEDVKIMNQRSHILYEELKGFVQRMDTGVVKKDLPPKTVFVVAVKLSPLQRKLYKRFLDVHGFTKDGTSDERLRKSFFAGYQALAQIWNHPGILQLRKDREYASPEDTVENFLVDDGSSDENLDYNTFAGEKPSTKEFMQKTAVGGFFRKGWWNDILNESNFKEIDYSGKMVLLLDILSMCSGIGDKALVFSQSIPTLDLIELYLSKLSRHEKSGKYWRKGKDWYRLDGRTESSERQKLVEMFNDPDNSRVKCTLISTRAGSLGINLHAANRVVIVDGSWNPTYDLQAIFRAWRYGQKKPVFAYRLMAHGTMEEKIYKRQVTKEGLAARVVDRQQIHRMISKEEMLHLFEFGDEEHPDGMGDHRETTSQSATGVAGNFPHNKVHASPGTCSSDKLMESLLDKHCPRWIANYHEHETYLQENEEEKLTKEEQDMAWEVYRRSLEWEEVQRVSLDDPLNDRKQHSVVPAPHPSSQGASRSGQQLSETAGVLPARDIMRRSLKVQQRKCTNLAHMLTLRSQGVKVGCSTVCGECAEEISWDGLKKT